MGNNMKFQALGRVTVYSMETGQASICHPVDAKERLARGGWSLEPVEVLQGRAGEGEKVTDLTAMTVKELRAYAKEKGIPIPAEATSKDSIIAVLAAAPLEPAVEGPEA